MGQRHQIFVKIANPAKHVYTRNAAEKKELEKEFGTDEFTILAYHNQWLFGRSALQNALNLLKFGKQFKREEKTDPKSWGGYNCPFTINGIKQEFSDTKKLVDTIAFIMNFRATNTAWVNAGIGGNFYIGKEDEGIREDFTMGDNNDGITIIDLVENKYCFMNIYEQDLVDKYDVRRLPMLKPVNAREYVSAYYGETIETTNPFYFGDHDRSKVTKTVAQQQKIVDSNIKLNKGVAKGFDKFEVLTLAEIQAMFTKMKLIPKKGEKIKLTKQDVEKLSK